MPKELTNLLPPERERAVARNYLLHVGVVVIVLVTALTMSAAVLLIPTYVYLGGSANTKKVYLANIESTFSSADEEALEARLTALSDNAAVLTSLSDARSVSATIRAILSVAHPGIALSGFSYTPPANKTPGTVQVSGSSVTREALHKYQLALQSASFARSAVLPVSAYAKDTDISFTITVTLSP